MKKIHFLSTACLLIIFAGCSTSNIRSPSSIESTKNWDDLIILKQRQIELGALSVHYQKKKNDFKLVEVRKEQEEIVKKIEEIENRVTSFEDASKQSVAHVSKEWRLEKEKLELSILSLYKQSKNVELSVSTFEAHETEVKLTHQFFSGAGYRQINKEETPAMDFTMKCDAPFEIKYGLSTKKIKANELTKFSLGDKKISNDWRKLIFHPNMKTCDVKFVSSLDHTQQVYGFRLINESLKYEKLSSLMSTTEVCSIKKGTSEFINTNEFVNLLCPSKYDSIQILPEPEDSLHARVINLLGQDLPEDFLKNGNPFGELDFSKAPKFDSILVSYLVFRADFYGTLIGRLLAHHADKGAVVKILISSVITHPKDEVMFEKMMANHPNIKIVKYRFETTEQGGAFISEFHRTNHVKLFAAYSKENPNLSFAILGGRNIHDGFVFKTPVDVTKYPEVVNYAGGDESWAYWRDFEMVVKGQEFVEAVTRNFMNFYHINKENLVMKISSVAVQKDNAVDSAEQTMRHLVSIPFKDEPNLNLFYAKMLDSAKKKILISSPYFRPVKEIVEAINRAIARGVDITIITRLDLEGDTADFILGAVNKEGVNHFIKKVKVFEYTEPKVILHSKLVMIDDEFSFISSVNLNKRSFYHDLENGVIVNDPQFTKNMGEVYKEYLTLSKQLTEHQKVVFWKKWIITIFDKVL